jgi:hypothetical protein
LSVPYLRRQKSHRRCDKWTGLPRASSRTPKCWSFLRCQRIMPRRICIAPSC